MCGGGGGGVIDCYDITSRHYVDLPNVDLLFENTRIKLIVKSTGSHQCPANS